MYHFVLIPHVSDIIWYLSFSVCLTSLSMTISRSIHPAANGSASFFFMAEWYFIEAETPILWPPDAKNWLIWKRPWCWERLKAGGEGDDRGRDGWMASLTRWMWVWVTSGSWWWTGRPGVLPSMGLQRVGHDWATKLNKLIFYCMYIPHLTLPLE